MKAKKVFVGLWVVVVLFLAGFIALLIASFTTHPTDFSGGAIIHLKFENPSHQALTPVITNEKGEPVAPSADGEFILFGKFESRETNIYDRLSGGPRPRTSIVSFFEDGTKHHEMMFTYDRHDHVWQCEVSFPDPTIAKVDLENSSLVFKGESESRRQYESVISAKALIGPPIINND